MADFAGPDCRGDNCEKADLCGGRYVSEGLIITGMNFQEVDSARSWNWEG